MKEREKPEKMDATQALQNILDLFVAGADEKKIRKAINALPGELQDDAWKLLSHVVAMNAVVSTGRAVVVSKGNVTTYGC